MARGRRRRRILLPALTVVLLLLLLAGTGLLPPFGGGSVQGPAGAWAGFESAPSRSSGRRDAPAPKARRGQDSERDRRLGLAAGFRFLLETERWDDLDEALASLERGGGDGPLVRRWRTLLARRLGVLRRELRAGPERGLAAAVARAGRAAPRLLAPELARLVARLRAAPPPAPLEVQDGLRVACGPAERLFVERTARNGGRRLLSFAAAPPDVERLCPALGRLSRTSPPAARAWGARLAAAFVAAGEPAAGWRVLAAALAGHASGSRPANPRKRPKPVTPRTKDAGQKPGPIKATGR